MNTNTTTVQIAGMALSQAVAEAYINRASVGTTAIRLRRDYLEVPGKYVVRNDGKAEVVVRVDPGYLKRAMDVRAVNQQIDGDYHVDLSTANLIAR